MSTTKQDQEFDKLMQSEVDVTVSFSSSALDMAADFIASTFNPEDVFSKKDLERWAESNGYVKE